MKKYIFIFAAMLIISCFSVMAESARLSATRGEVMYIGNITEFSKSSAVFSLPKNDFGTGKLQVNAKAGSEQKLVISLLLKENEILLDDDRYYEARVLAKIAYWNGKKMARGLADEITYKCDRVLKKMEVTGEGELNFRIENMRSIC